MGFAYSSEKAQIMFDQFPQAQAECWESAGHLVFEDEPELFMKIIANFLKNSPKLDEQQVKQWKNSFSSREYRIPNEVQRSYLRRR